MSANNTVNVYLAFPAVGVLENAELFQFPYVPRVGETIVVSRPDSQQFTVVDVRYTIDADGTVSDGATVILKAA